MRKEWVQRLVSYSKAGFIFKRGEHLLYCHSQKPTASSNRSLLKANLRSIAMLRVWLGQWQPEICLWYLVRGYLVGLHSRPITSVRLLSPSHHLKRGRIYQTNSYPL